MVVGRSSSQLKQHFSSPYRLTKNDLVKPLGTFFWTLAGHLRYPLVLGGDGATALTLESKLTDPSSGMS